MDPVVSGVRMCAPSTQCCCLCSPQPRWSFSQIGLPRSVTCGRGLRLSLPSRPHPSPHTFDQHQRRKHELVSGHSIRMRPDASTIVHSSSLVTGSPRQGNPVAIRSQRSSSEANSNTLDTTSVCLGHTFTNEFTAICATRSRAEHFGQSFWLYPEG